MTEGFAQVPLGTLCDILDKQRKPITRRDRKPGPYPYYGATGVLDFVEGYIFDEPLVLVGEDGAKWKAGENTAFAVSGKAWVNNHAHVLRPKRDRILDSWLIYYLNAADLSGFATGLTVPKLNQARLREIPIPLPPLPEQKRILAILDEAFSGIRTAIANTEKNVANARELFYCYLNKIFTVHAPWDVVTVDKVCESIVDCVNKTAPTVDGPTPYKMIRTTNVRHGEISLKSVKYVTEDVFRAWTRRQIPKRGDVILTREAPLGEVGVLDTEEKIFLGQRLVSYRTNPDKLNSRFLSYAFQSEYVQSQIRALASGSTVQHMRVPDSSKLNIRLPSLEVQNEAVRSLDFIKKETTQLKTICQRKMEVLTELKQSLLQKAFSGELTAEAADEVQEAVA